MINPHDCLGYGLSSKRLLQALIESEKFLVPIVKHPNSVHLSWRDVYRKKRLTDCSDRLYFWQYLADCSIRIRHYHAKSKAANLPTQPHPHTLLVNFLIPNRDRGGERDARFLSTDMEGRILLLILLWLKQNWTFLDVFTLLSISLRISLTHIK